MRLSIIVPVYKAENSIRKCIDSILLQSFRDWELILVDDGSPDSSGDICEEYAKYDCRIKVLHKKNEGVSIARNLGLKYATGDYVTFVDSDDYIEGDCFGLLLNSDSDLVVFESISYKSDGSIKYWYDIDDRKIVTYNGIKDFISSYINVFVLDGPCGKFLKRSAVKDIYFPEGQPLGEDNVFMLFFISRCKSVELKRGAYYVIYDHYNNDFDKYLMPASTALMCIENVMHAYYQVNISVPSFENRMFNIFSMVRDVNSDTECWYNSLLVKELERKYLKFQSHSFRVYYCLGKYKRTKYIGHFLFWNYSKMVLLVSSVFSKLVKCIKIRS